MPPSPPVIETAPTGRARCRACGQPIAKGSLRLGERVPNAFADAADAETTLWYHPTCAAFRRPEAFVAALDTAPADLVDRDVLAAEAALGLAHRRAVRIDRAGRAPSGRATCRACKQLIARDMWRIGLVFYEDGRFAPSGYIHAACASAYFETTAVMPRVRHFSPELGEAELADVAAALA